MKRTREALAVHLPALARDLGAQVTLLLLWTYAPNDGDDAIVWPSAKALAQTLGASERTVRRRLRRLERAGAIVRTTRRTEYRKNRLAWLLVLARTEPVAEVTPRPRPKRQPATRDAAKLKRQAFDARVAEVFVYFNGVRREAVPGARYLDATVGNLKALRSRLREHTVDECKAVIDAWANECRIGWQGDTAKPRHHFVPSTVFRPEGFEMRLQRADAPANPQPEQPPPRFVSAEEEQPSDATGST